MFGSKKKQTGPEEPLKPGERSLWGVRMTQDEKKNTLRHTASYGINHLWTVLTANSFLQGFLLHFGLTESNISDYQSILTIAALFGYVFFIGYSGYGKRDQLIYVASTLGYMVTPTVLILGGVLELSAGAFFTVLCIGGILTTLCQSLNGVCDSVMMRRSMPAASIGQVLSIGIMVGSVVGLGVSAGASGLLDWLGFPNGYYILFGISILLCIPVCILHSRLKLHPVPEEILEQQGKTRENYLKRIWQSMSLFFKHKESRQIFFPSMLRGLKYTPIAMATVIIAHNVELSDALIGATATVRLAAMLLGNLIFANVVHKISLSRLLAFGAIVGCAGMVVMGIATDAVVALAAFFVLSFGTTFYDQAYPTAVMVRMPEFLLPACTSVRHMSFSLLMTCALPIAGRLIENDMVLPLILAAVVAWGISAVVSCIIFREKKQG